MNDNTPNKTFVDNLQAAALRALGEYNRLHVELAAAEKNLRIAEKRHLRAYLWQKANKLRDELAKVENEAASIKLED